MACVASSSAGTLLPACPDTGAAVSGGLEDPDSHMGHRRLTSGPVLQVTSEDPAKAALRFALCGI